MARLSFRWLWALPLSACAFISDDHEAWRLDPDGDGIDLASDCDSTDAAVGGPLTWHMDLDGDGYGDPDSTVDACERPDDAVANSDDCWDDPDNIPDDFVALNGLPQPDPATVYPGADNALYDGINQSCAESFEDFDGDGDGYASAHYADRSGAVGEDCIDGGELDDENLAGLDPEDVNPEAAEVWYDGTDADCDGTDCDQDGDGYDGGVGSKACAPVDCDDEDASISPDSSVTEVFYNGVDDNCDISTGDQDGDQDGDGYWASDYEALVAKNGAEPLDIPDGVEGDCWDDPESTPADFVAINGFTQPTAAEVSPAATESWWDGVDADCAGDDDFDADGDGYAYDGYPDREGRYGDDCYDAVGQPDPFDNLAGLDPALVNAGAIENFYDGTDADCDGNDDDQDEDGYAAESAGGTDCDDTDPDTYPGAPETVGDGVDNDCDGAEVCFTDSDGDGYRSEETVTSTDSDCSDAGEALESASQDCNDDASAAYPDAAILCEDGAPDNDCDGETDDECLLGDTLSPLGELSAASGGGGYLGGALDLTSDGDIIIGAPDADTVYFVLGPVTADVSLDSASGVYTITGGGSDQSGSAVDGGGDVDGDGSLDLLIGAVGLDGGSTDVGGAWFVEGPLTGDLSLSTSTATRLIGTQTSTGAGVSVSSSGDFNDDGFDDILIGSHVLTSSTGQSQAGGAYLIYGSATVSSGSLTSADARWEGEAAGDGAGRVVAAAGDLDGDGYDEIAISGQGHDQSGTDDGCAYLIYGASSTSSGTASLSGADAKLCGVSGGDGAGFPVGPAGDLDGDGYDDLLVSAIDALDSGVSVGVLYAVYGQLSAYAGTETLSDVSRAAFVGEASGDDFSYSAEGVGDISGDGEGDLLVGAYQNDSSAGAAYLFYGPFSGERAAAAADAIFTGDAGSAAGFTVAGGVDVTADDWGDLLVGAPANNSDDGMVTLIEGTGY